MSRLARIVDHELDRVTKEQRERLSMGINEKKPTVEGPAEWFTGEVWIDSLVEPTEDSLLNVGVVHFTPGARTAWHSHEGGQHLYVLEGVGLVQARGERILELHPGDVHSTESGQEHWHGAAHDHFMAHVSMTQGPPTWGDHVTDDQYGAARSAGH